VADKPADKTAKEPKTMDVSKPGKTPTPTTSKHVIITNKPEQADPMVNSEDGAQEVASEGKSATLPTKSRVKIEPINDDVKPEEDDATKPTEEAPPEDEAVDNNQPESKEESTVTDSIDDEDDDTSKDSKPNAADEDLATKRAMERQAQLDKIAEAGTYHLPINQVVRRRSRHVAIAGAVLILLLAVAWVDIALDAKLITIPGVKPITHLFEK
jgi:hypothetical protein